LVVDTAAASSAIKTFAGQLRARPGLFLLRLRMLAHQQSHGLKVWKKAECSQWSAFPQKEPDGTRIFPDASQTKVEVPQSATHWHGAAVAAQLAKLPNCSCSTSGDQLLPAASTRQ
jgi:hypothetical protein